VLAVQHLGVELHAVQPRAVSSNDATGVAGVELVTVKPGGACDTASPCDIQTDCEPGSPGEQHTGVDDGERRAAELRRPGRATVPPSEAAIAWKP
jgi:hypothetical protein